MKAIQLTIIALALLLTAGSHAEKAPVRPVLIGIYAQDYASTISWYRDCFGFETTKEVVNDRANLRLGFLDNGAFELEIYADIEPDSQATRLARDRFGMPGEGFVKLSLESEDLAGLADKLKSLGVEFVVETKKSDRKEGVSWFMVADPDGNLIQVFGPTEQDR